MQAILFVCTANLCRSPLAEGIFRKLVAERGCAARFEVQSAGTHEYHVGSAPAPFAVAAARTRGCEIGAGRARQVGAADFEAFDHILAMERAHVAHLRRIAPTRCASKIELLLAYGERYAGQEVPDPFGRDAAAYALAADMIEDGCRGLVELLVPR